MTNGHHENGDANDSIEEEQRPVKRQRLDTATPAPTDNLKIKPESPPWKKVLAEGPTSFTQDGRRKSGRVNAVPLELQPPSNKRQTRGAVQKTQSNVLNGKGNRNSLSGAAAIHSASPTTAKRPTSASSSLKSPARPTSSPKTASRPSEHTPTVEKRSHKKGAGKKDTEEVSSHKSRRSTRTQDHDTPTNGVKGEYSTRPVESSSASKIPRIRFRVSPVTIPLLHPDHVPKRAPRFSSFEDFILKGFETTAEDGGLLSADEDYNVTNAAAEEDARLILRMEQAAEGQGVLSATVSSVYRPETSELSERRGPLRQYAHQDHLTRAVTEFRLLMVEELRRHKRNAKRLAEACRDEWHRKQPKSEEELEAEAVLAGQIRYRLLVKTLQSTWDNVRAEVNRRRLKEWEAQEQIRVRKALNEAVDLSTMKLEARRARSVEVTSDGDDDNASDGDDESDSASESSESEGNMSSSESEAEEPKPTAEAAEDEKLTVEELRVKYANLPETPVAEQSDEEIETDPDAPGRSDIDSNMQQDGTEVEDSDESIDMDDDLGSSDEDQDSDEDEESEVDSDGADEDTGGSSLLGFLAPSDRAQISKPEPLTSQIAVDEGDVVDEEDEVSLIPHISDIQEAKQPDNRAIQFDHMEVDTELAAATEDTTGIDVQNGHQTPEIDTEMDSGGRSSQPTPTTNVTKQSEADSVSSVEMQQVSRQTSPVDAIQPSNALKTPVPFLLRGTLREYQHYGLDWLAGLYANNTNGILADEMGLGKTIQTIALLAHLACEHHVWGAHLVIVPTSVMLNWEMEFKKWCPGFKILTYYGTQEERKRKRQGWQNEDTWNVVITSYQLVLQDQQVFKRRRWHYMILDEAHNIKNFRSQRWQTLLTFNTRARLLLTGTPLQNNLTELWSLLFFLMPSDGSEQSVGGFADLKEFSDWFRKPQEQILENGRETMDDEARAIISKLHKVLRPYLLRRMKADVEKQMPAKYEHVEYCRLSRRQRELYDGFLSRSDTRGTLASGNYLSIINCLMQLRKVCNHPDLFQERPILSSFPMKQSAIADFEIKDLLVRRKLLRQQPMETVSLSFLNLVPTKNENLSAAVTDRSAMLTAQRTLMDMREAQRARAQHALFNMDPSTVRSNLVYLESASRWGRFEELQHCVYLNALRRQQKPVYGSGLVKLLTIHKRLDRNLRPRPIRKDLVIDWQQENMELIKALTPTLEERSESMHTTIQKFACITPPILTPDALPIVLSKRGVEYFQTSSDRLRPDPFHEARMRLSVQFPDKRLLQYDCGKLQALDKLLRRLQSGGHRALIFTQMTKVLDILEQFLNIHGHRYLRLDGSTKIEQRQTLTDRFNNDTRILAFILSSRSGGLGINLTGADTVIFYDLDWNPAMDKQCQDRAHRIGQTRDVHIYRMVSEHTIEANILRKANQKRMLDDVVIQEGEFTTDYFNKVEPREIIAAEAPLSDADAAANAAMDRVLGGPSTGGDVTRVLAQAEDQEDVAAAKVAQQEIVQTDAADFDERAVSTNTPPTGAATPVEDPLTAVDDNIDDVNANIDAVDADEINAWGEAVKSTDDYMLRIMTEQLKDTPLELPKDKNRSKRGKDHRNRSHRAR